MSRHPADVPDFLRRDANNHAPWMDQRKVTAEEHDMLMESLRASATETQPLRMPWDD